ncbi:MAG TPA: mucoidy inhibitor MuiA family protein [Anaerolineaceae bacterium]|nr:mucoidy inhibitor MuiA family protein [Anaerolineaceae bacterium]HPN50876.1 mucoidy inhibitor MuiA family protein [Anaerolineaceae bacterium]
MVELASTITAVTVYPDRARITRRGTVDLQNGLHQLVFPSLPIFLDPESVRASAQGTARIRLLNIDVERTAYFISQNEKVLELEETIQTIANEQQNNIDQIASIKKEMDHLDGLLDSSRTFAFSMASGKTSPENHFTWLSNIIEQRGRCLSTIRGLELQNKELASQLAKYTADLSALRSSRPKEGFQASVGVEILFPGTVEIELIYSIRQASWTPLYDFHLDENNQMSLTCLGEISQNTGENWSQVSLTLSTARPTAFENLPDVTPWMIHIQPPARPAYVARSMAEMPPPPAPMQAPEQALPDLMMAKAEVPTAEVQQQGSSVTYKISMPADIPADGSRHKVTIAMINMAVESDYLIAPRLDEAAYRRLKIKNESGLHLLPGAAQLFDKSDFVGATHIDLTIPGQELEMAYGHDDRVAVKRELTQKLVDKTFLGDKRRVRYTYKITVTNHTGANQTITVFEAFPLSQNEMIRVKLENASPRPTEQDELNRLKWIQSLTPGQEQEYLYEFSIESPRQSEIFGLTE